MGNLPGKSILDGLDGLLTELESDLTQTAKLLDDALQRASKSLGGIRTAWSERQTEVLERYQRVLRELQQVNVDGEAYIQVRQQLERLSPLKEQESTVRRSLRDQQQARRGLLVEWEDVKATEFRELERAAKRVSRQLSNKVRVTVAFASNREPVLQFINSNVSGRLTEALDILRRAENLSLIELAEAWRQGRDALVRRYHLSPSQAERLLQTSPDVVMQVEEFDLPATTSIELNVAAEGQAPIWQELDQLSTGQKATAILLLLLLESDAPLVVDQPEDDLDNRFVTEGIVPKMRDEKQRRQFIFASHNANIPVLGDAELIVGLTAAGDAGQGRAEVAAGHAGSIDARPVRELVEELLEGGKAAFEMRRLKYGF